MSITSRSELMEYCYRKLGAPLVEINMTEDQADDCIDEAISYFQDYYFDGIEKAYYKHLITQPDIDNGYISLPDNIIGVNRVFPGGGTTTAETNIFDLQYQLRMNDLRDLTAVSMVYYTQVMNHLALLDNLLAVQKQFRWNKLTQKLYIDQNWEVKAPLGTYILIDCYTALDPDVSTKFWNNRLLKQYCTAKFKQQWGMNIKKYQGITLPGGITLDGQGMYDEGKQEIEDIETDLLEKSAPLEWIMG